MNDSTKSPIPGRRRKSSGRRKAIIFGVVVLLAGGGWYGWKEYKARHSSEGEYMYGKVDTGDIEDLVASTGALQPREFVDVGAQVSGQIEKILVEVGDIVSAGDLLVSIDATTAQAKVDANEASIKAAKANLRTSENQLDKAKRDAERQKRLYEEGATTYESMTNAQTSYEDQQSRLEQSKSQLDQQEANARIEANNLRYAKIIAPISGTVMSIDVKQGQTVNATNSVPKVLRIANLGTMTIQSDVSEADVAKLYDGNVVYFTTLGGNNRRWYSKLKRIEPTPKVSNSVVLYNALFDIENDGTSLRPSMTAQVYFVAAEAKGVKRVPMAALQQGQQIQRELAAKAEKDRKEGKTPANATGAPAPGAPGARPGAAANTAAGGAAAAGSAPAPAAREGQPQAGGAPANRQANAQGGNRPSNGQGAAGGGFGGQRQGGAGGGGFGGQRTGGGGGFGATPTTAAEVVQRYNLAAPELKLTPAQTASIDKLATAYLADMAKLPPIQQGQMDQAAMQARQAPRTKLIADVGKVLTAEQNKTFEAAQTTRRGGGGNGGFGGAGGGAPGGGGFGGGAPGGGGFNAGGRTGGPGGGNFNRQGAAANTSGTPAATQRPVQRRSGIVMVKKVDGTLEPRQIVVGVTDRVLGEVISGLEEGEEVVIGKTEKQSAVTATQQQRPNNNNNNNNNFPGGNRGGGNFNGGGNFRPF